MKFSAETLGDMNSRHRANLINSLTGFRQTFVVGTVGDDGCSNAAIFNSLTHIGASPPLLGILFRPVDGFQRDTYSNLKRNGEFACSIVTEAILRRAHATSGKFEPGVSEFERCKLEESYETGWKSPFVANSPLKMGLRFRDEYPITVNRTILVVGEIEHIEIPEETIEEHNHLSMEKLGAVPINGLYTYFQTPKQRVRLPYVKEENVGEVIDEKEA